MSYPESVANRDVIIGGGVHAAVYAATRYRLFGERPIVIEKRSELGGVFARLIPFAMNSANRASLESAGIGPSRIPSRSASDDLNYLPNSAFQVSEVTRSEYPASNSMALMVRDTLSEYAEVFTNADVTIDRDGYVYRQDTDDFLGMARRIIWAAGLAMPKEYREGSPVQSAETFLARRTGTGRFQTRNYAGQLIAVVGAGDTAATVIEYLLGQGLETPTSLAERIDWYGGSLMPMTKKLWSANYHARYMGIARHMPEKKVAGIITPYQARGEIADAGSTAYVNGRTYDLVIDATGFQPVTCPVSLDYSYDGQSGYPIARFASGAKVYSVGTAASLINPQTYGTRFAASRQAIYQLAPLTAEFAAKIGAL